MRTVKQVVHTILSILFVLVIVFSPCGTLSAAETDPNRFALAISGGASMGAYEAGLIWGLVEVLRQVE